MLPTDKNLLDFPWLNMRFLYFGGTVEPPYNEPLYNDVLGTMNDFLYPSHSKIYEKDPRYNKLPRYREQILPVPWPWLYRGSTVSTSTQASIVKC